MDMRILREPEPGEKTQALYEAVDAVAKVISPVTSHCPGSFIVIMSTHNPSGEIDVLVAGASNIEFRDDLATFRYRKRMLEASLLHVTTCIEQIEREQSNQKAN